MDSQTNQIKETKKTIVILEVKGKLDILSSSILDKKFNELFHQGEKYFILDFSELEYLTSSGIRIIIFALKKAQSHAGKLIICSLQEAVEKVLTISGLTSSIPIAPNRQEAFKYFA